MAHEINGFQLLLDYSKMQYAYSKINSRRRKLLSQNYRKIHRDKDLTEFLSQTRTFD